MAARVHRPLKVIAFNANGIWKQRYELSKQLQDLHIDVAFLSETHLKPHAAPFEDKAIRRFRCSSTAIATASVTVVASANKSLTDSGRLSNTKCALTVGCIF
jgi:uroporphyrinogen-III synthase